MAGQFDNIKLEMAHQKLDILGICETRWTGNGRITSDDTVLLYSGGEEHARGVGILLTKSAAESLCGC